MFALLRVLRAKGSSPVPKPRTHFAPRAPPRRSRLPTITTPAQPGRIRRAHPAPVTHRGRYPKTRHVYRALQARTQLPMINLRVPNTPFPRAPPGRHSLPARTSPTQRAREPVPPVPFRLTARRASPTVKQSARAGTVILPGLRIPTQRALHVSSGRTRKTTTQARASHIRTSRVARAKVMPREIRPRYVYDINTCSRAVDVLEYLSRILCL